eukprot:g34102.t1
MTGYVRSVTVCSNGRAGSLQTITLPAACKLHKSSPVELITLGPHLQTIALALSFLGSFHSDKSLEPSSP